MLFVRSGMNRLGPTNNRTQNAIEAACEVGYMASAEHGDVLASTQTIIGQALKRLGYGDDMYELLKEPMRVLTVRIPVRMDDGVVKVFTGYRVSRAA